MTQIQTCDTCRWWNKKRFPGNDPRGFCYLNPPIVLTVPMIMEGKIVSEGMQQQIILNSQSVWPMTLKDDYCSKYENAGE